MHGRRRRDDGQGAASVFVIVFALIALAIYMLPGWFEKVQPTSTEVPAGPVAAAPAAPQPTAAPTGIAVQVSIPPEPVTATGLFTAVTATGTPAPSATAPAATPSPSEVAEVARAACHLGPLSPPDWFCSLIDRD